MVSACHKQTNKQTKKNMESSLILMRVGFALIRLSLSFLHGCSVFPDARHSRLHCCLRWCFSYGIWVPMKRFFSRTLTLCHPGDHPLVEGTRKQGRRVEREREQVAK